MSSTYRTNREIFEDNDGPDPEDYLSPVGGVVLTKPEPLNEPDDAPF